MCLFPMEIWDVIFTLACDPRGITAAAISGVSWYFYKAIGPYRLTSLVIFGRSQIMAFNEAMKVMPPNVPRAKHLYIGFIPDSDIAETQQVCSSFIDGWIQHREEEEGQRSRQISHNKHLSTFANHPANYNNVQSDDVGGIISQHRDTLESLTYLMPVSTISFDMFGQLPNLRVLTIVCLRYKATFYGAPHHDPVRRRTQFPSLERLHLNYFDTTPLFNHDEFRRVAPNLTHLRISGRKCYPQYEKHPVRTKVLMQPILLSSQEQGPQVAHLRRILSNPSYEKRTVLIEPGHREDSRYGFFDALLDWLDVSTGGNAFWDQGNTVTIESLATRRAGLFSLSPWMHTHNPSRLIR